MERSHGNANQQTKIIAIRSNESKAFSTQEALLTLFHSLILSHTNEVAYCITTWFYGRSVLLNKLQKLCNKFINMIICTNPAKKRNKEITKDNIVNIQQLYKLNISICMYKSFHKQLPSAFDNIFQRKTSTVITRSNSQIIAYVYHAKTQ